jgi:hypothetical protein
LQITWGKNAFNQKKKKKKKEKEKEKEREREKQAYQIVALLFLQRRKWRERGRTREKLSGCVLPIDFLGTCCV